ncbi:hypothetical protein SAMN05216431_103132 [Ligilactobacillus sp. WC1T17]|uniref:Uncharacterized protein n=1 Tax=Ligilactobacillus ruminis TaxID=1623 RepID=A0ABY1AAC3_9LACO|nr:hypothetical protein SAMN05216431_103132 [Ligilactobacillus ruminis]
MQLIFNHQLFWLDPNLEQCQNSVESETVFLTSLQPRLKEKLALLAGSQIYISQELYLLLQKLNRFLKTDYNLTAVKIIPYTFAQMFDDISVTALSNDDGFFGSYVLLFDDGQQKIGYAPRFITQGWHKKRLKKWKKAFKDAQLTQLILSSKITQPASQALPDLSHYQQVLMADKPQDLLIKGNPFSLDTLFKMDDICQKLAIKAYYPELMANLMHAFNPWKDYQSGLATEVIDLSMTDLSLPQTVTTAEVNDLITVINPQKVVTI